MSSMFEIFRTFPTLITQRPALQHRSPVLPTRRCRPVVEFCGRVGDFTVIGHSVDRATSPTARGASPR